MSLYEVSTRSNPLDISWICVRLCVCVCVHIINNAIKHIYIIINYLEAKKGTDA